ncbi:MAG: hypothetical protein ACJAWO_000076 [Halieaceae bacterium]|jgi:hypothetical protein
MDSVVMVAFIVNEKGEVENVNLVSGCHNLVTNKVGVDLVSAMPKWESAQSVVGEKVAQYFQLSSQKRGC